MARRFVLAAVICAIILIAGRVASLNEGWPPHYPAPQAPIPRLIAMTDNPVSVLTRHDRLGRWVIDIIFANPLLPDNQENGELIFKVFLMPAVGASDDLDLARGARLVNSEGTVGEEVRWQLESHAAGRTSGYLIVAAPGHPQMPLVERTTRWIRLVLTDQSGESVIFEWNLTPLINH